MIGSPSLGGVLCRIREGQELIAMSQADLAEGTGIRLAVVVRAELAAYMQTLKRQDSPAIQGALEAAGVEFIREDGGPGVQLWKAGQTVEASSR